MNRYQKIALFILFGIPLFFLIISLVTSNWGFFLWSIPSSVVAGTTGFYAAKNFKKE